MKGILLAIFGVFLVGCSTNLANYSIVSTGNVPIPTEKHENYVEGESCLFYFLGIPFGNSANRHSAATADALEEASKDGFPAEGLTNVTVWESAWSIILFGGDCVKVRGEPFQFER
ncbi:hypothetical protein CCY99_03250 [Helicobacter sp. 16-1353]|uniref:hypothetical protein n=1 Tax=Helicobacter sp. 16-1353 TaxID=2004996 RepID=UPI000DCE547B|nr:hypothetical protein [Helicobacter sp. 16-1353]RAX54385.1 hypothetical protein CCY99_03250 [Helicobacter sp. 16-1353]